MTIRHQDPRAFTLIELLVVLATIAMLAALLAPVLSRVREQGDSTKCSANLRQIGIAINAYCGDNDGVLPGPLKLGQRATFEKDEEGSLARILQKYVGGKEREGENSDEEGDDRKSVFVCPAWKRAKKESDSPVYIINDEKIPDLEQNPWGDLDANQKPLRQAALTGWKQKNSETGEEVASMTRKWAMTDVDVELFKNGVASPEFANKLPRTPVHTDHRNALFYDWHVEKISLERMVEIQKEALRAGME